MALLRTFEDREYLPEYGTLLLRDAEPWGPARVRVDELLREYAVRTQACGSIARAGDGWIEGRASDGYHAVRLESHDAPPSEDDDWADVVETPLATAGTVGLTTVTGGAPRDSFRLGEPGLYRLRFCRRPADDGDSYLLRFWPVPADPGPPRWLVRSRPLLSEHDLAQPTMRTRGGGPAARFRYATSDLLSLLLWARESEATVTLHWLADRLLSTPDAVRAVLRHAVDDGLLAPFDGTDGPMTLVIRPTPRETRQAPPQPPTRPAGTGRLLGTGGVVRSEARAGSHAGTCAGGPPHASGPAMAWVATTGSQAPERGTRSPTPPPGPPPRAGLVGSGGELVMWRDDAPVVVARWPGVQVARAMQSRHGTVLLTSTQTVLVRPDGEFVLLGTDMGWHAVLDAAGDQLAAVEYHVGRRPRHRLHLVDLADGSRRSMPWDETDHVSAVGIHAGAVYASVDGGGASVRWVPGEEPEPLPHALRQVDPYSGVALARGGSHPVLLVRPDGEVVPLPVDPAATLVPGGRQLCSWVHAPPGLRLYDPARPDRPRMLALPGGSATGPRPGGPVWESPEHVLIPAQDGHNEIGASLVRLHLRSGLMEGLTLPPEVGYRPVLVRPLFQTIGDDQPRSAGRTVRRPHRPADP
ncbi:hypothetical protein KBX06_08910 [Micromonospora sp. C31]|uniref:hypothetical protein n=1 Tax=Micromonospora sp. C31 TaxID=2824876 RepID=UPI001B36F0B2|nr:hypothetical protein [Micromonospora sp. C31]MBQ1073284.1 hypothetical protein [Micromonospora sp. C31]